ncbi:unnamed protein product [Menidia menidia]|uniref:(Atlantic silverside) hypothetical protein n=1 Tax=Menidia menidia TaxID=238744 RepID=A0A8S4APU2_9TELE|nr:unnamed protein product [Menidia menidia]
MVVSTALRRRWTWCSTQPEPPGVDGGFEFSVMTYNILSQELLRDNAYLYRHCHPAHLPWEYRLPNLLTEIQQHAADILCLQEVQQDHYEAQIKPALQALGYQCEFKKRTGKKPDGCAVSFKTSRFSLLSSKPVEFFRGGDALLDRDNVGLILLLQPTGDPPGDPPGDPSSCVCVANTHLLYNPHRGDVKLAQLAILLAEIGRVSRLPDGSSRPVLLCGDLNSSPQSPLYSFLTRGRLEYKGLRIGMVSGQEILLSGGSRGQRRLQSPIWSPKLGISRRCRYESKRPKFTPAGPPPAVSDPTVQDPDPGEPDGPSRWKEFRWSIEHGLSLRSAYGHRLEPEGRPEITTCHSRTAQTVDYILYSPDSGASLPGGRGLQLLGRLSLVSQLELEEVNSLPNQHHSSDHLPLLVRFRLRP